MNKRKLSLLLVLILLLGFIPIKTKAQVSDIKLWVDGKYVKTDSPPFIINDRVLVPIRFVAETLGYDIYWEEDKGFVNIFKDKDSLKILTGIPIVDHNNKSYTFLELPQIINDRVYIPIRDIGLRFNKEVNWDYHNRTVVIGSGYPYSKKNKSGNIEPSDLEKETALLKSYLGAGQTLADYNLSKQKVYNIINNSYGKKAADYVIANVKADWKKNLIYTAKYLKFNHRNDKNIKQNVYRELIDEYLFTPEEAQYAIDNFHKIPNN